MLLGSSRKTSCAIRRVLADQSQRIKIVGLAGIDGATTSSCLIASILTASSRKVGIVGGLGCFDGRHVAHFRGTTPPPQILTQCLARMIRNGCTHAVLDVSPRALRERWLDGLALDVACLIHRDGSAGRGTRSGQVGASPAQLLEHLAPEGLAIIPADDPFAVDRVSQHDGPVLTVGIRAEAEITAAILEQFPSEQTILLSAGIETAPVRTRMIGTRHAYYCLTAAAVGLAYGIDLRTVIRGLETIEYVPGQLERIECGQPFSVFIDSTRKPRAIRTCLAALREVIRGRILCVFGARGARGNELANRDERRRRGRYRRGLGRAVECGADLAVITDDDPRDEDPQAIIEDILAGLKQPAEAEVIPDRTEAIAWTLSQAKPGDAVLLAGTRYRSGRVVGDMRRSVDDRRIARDWLSAIHHE